MKVIQFAILLLMLVTLSCRPNASNGEIFVIIRVQNKAGGNLVAATVDGGRGEANLGYVISDPDSRKTYVNFLATANAQLNFRYQFENGSIQSATNLLGRGIRANEDITITVTDSGVSAKAVDGKH